MRIPHPLFRFGVTLLGAASRQEWIARESRMTGTMRMMLRESNLVYMDALDHLGRMNGSNEE